MQEISSEPVTARLQKIMAEGSYWVGGLQNERCSIGNILDAILNTELTHYDYFWHIQRAYNVWPGLHSEFFTQTVPERKVPCAGFMSDPRKWKQ